MKQSKKFNELMQSYTMPRPSNNLAAKIIEQSLNIEQKQSLWGFINKTFAELSLPSPIYNFISVLLIGFVAGFSSFTGADDIDSPDSAIEQLLDNEQDLL